MALRIIRSEEPITVNQLVVVIYGAPGLGKTTLGFTAESPLVLDFDRGAYRAAIRGDSVQVDSWEDVTNITAEDLEAYNTVVVDTAGRAKESPWTTRSSGRRSIITRSTRPLSPCSC